MSWHVTAGPVCCFRPYPVGPLLRPAIYRAPESTPVPTQVRSFFTLAPYIVADQGLVCGRYVFGKGGQYCGQYDYRAVYTRDNKARITESAAYVSRELGHLYDHGLYKKLVRSFCAVYTSSSRLT